MKSGQHLLHLVGYAIRGGCERCCEVFIRHSPEREHTVLVLGERGPMSEVWERLGAKVVHLEILSSGWVAFHHRVRQAFHAFRSDGVILWAGIRVPLLFAALAPLRLPVLLHAGNPFRGDTRLRLLLRAGGLLPRPRGAVVIGCSVHVARSYRHAPYYRHLAVESCLNPIEAPPANPHHARALERDEVVRLGMVARLDPIKDHRTLLLAFERLLARWPRAELHLAGDGPLRGPLEEMVRHLGVAERVCFHGSIGHVTDFLRGLDLFTYFTTPEEGMGNALAEAMAQGLPCVVNDLGVMREVGGDGDECAVHFTADGAEAAADAMSELLDDVERRRELSQAAFVRANRWFAPRHVVERYLALMQEEPA